MHSYRRRSQAAGCKSATFLSSMLALWIAFPARTAPPHLSERIQPYAKNPSYWQYQGKPVLLLGGSKDDNLFQLPNLEAHLDEIQRAGGNCIRNTMSDRRDFDFEVYPYLRLETGQYDLNRWNPEYWERFHNLLRWARDRDIIVQIEMWDRFDYSQQHWEPHPYNPKNNVNYTAQQSGLAARYPAPAWRDRQPFFHSIPGMPRYRKELDVIRNYQERFVAKVLSDSLDYPHVLYCMNNETSTPVTWGQYWMRFIRDKAKAKGVSVFVTDMFDDVWKPKVSAKLKQAIDQPNLYPFLDVSQVNSRTFNEDHWNNFFWIVQQTKTRPRPLNHTKIYSDGRTQWGSGTPKDGVERFWRNLIAGAASCRFHRPGGGIGLNKTAQACIASARKAEALAPFWDVEARLDLLGDRESDEAYLAAQPGERYVLFFTDGGSVQLDLRDAKSTFKLRWINVQTGDWGAEDSVGGGRRVSIQAPSNGPWVVILIKS